MDIAHELYQADFGFDQQFQILLENDVILSIEKVIRHVPKKRLVIMGKYNNQSIVAKLFFAPNRSERHFKNELAGIKELIKNQAPTPTLIFSGTDKNNSLKIIILQQLTSAINLEQLLKQQMDKKIIFSILESVIHELAIQHVLGIAQNDLHLNNFLIEGNKVFTIDGGQIKTYPHILAKKISLYYLALLFSQLNISKEEKIYLFNSYARFRGFIISEKDRAYFFRSTERIKQKRWRGYQKKIFRNSSHFIKIKTPQLQGMAQRKYLPQNLLNNVPALINNYASQGFVINKYPFKNLWHFFRHLFFISFAKKDWQHAQQKYLFNLSVERPIAFFERKFLNICFESYFISKQL